MAKAKKKKDGVIPKILIGVPILSWTHEFAESFLKFWTDLMIFSHKGREFHIAYKFMYRMPVHKAEESLANLAVESGCTHLLLMDDDIYDVTAENLMTLLDADKDVISGIMFASSFPYAMCAFRRYDRKTKVADQPILKGPARLYEMPPEQRVGIQKVDLIPFCFTLIKTKVFKGMKKPWFNSDTQAPTDSWFADRILAKKYDYYAHFDVWLNHRGITPENQKLWFHMGLIKVKKERGKVVTLTPEEMRRHESYMSLRLSEAEEQLKTNVVGRLPFMKKSRRKAIATPVKEKGGK